MGETQTKPVTINQAIQNALEEGATAVLITLVSADLPLVVGNKLFIKETGDRLGDLGDSDLNQLVANQVGQFLNSREEARLFRAHDIAPHLGKLTSVTFLFERIEGEPRLVIAGAGHVGASLARLAALSRYHVTLIDDRPEFVNRDAFASISEKTIELVLAHDWGESVRTSIGNGRGVSVAIVTRGHKQDEDCLRATIEAHPDYIGMIGSKRRTNIVLDKLREEGADEEKLRQVRAPIGLDIGAVSPEEVALSILAEIVAARRGASGHPLSEWRRTPHTHKEAFIDEGT